MCPPPVTITSVDRYGDDHLGWKKHVLPSTRGAGTPPARIVGNRQALENLPSGRYWFTAVWTGVEMLVWGGFDGLNYLNTGGRYSPWSDSWLPTSDDEDVPVGRCLHSAVWTGRGMVVWGGHGARRTPLLKTGGRYSPLTDTGPRRSPAPPLLWVVTVTRRSGPERR